MNHNTTPTHYTLAQACYEMLQHINTRTFSTSQKMFTSSYLYASFGQYINSVVLPDPWCYDANFCSHTP